MQQLRCLRLRWHSMHSRLAREAWILQGRPARHLVGAV